MIDVFTHSIDYYPSPVLYPITNRGFDGLAWSEPVYLALNYVLLVAAYLWLFRTRRRSTAIGSTTGRSHALGAHFSVENRLSTAIMVKFASLSLRYIAMLLASCATRNMEHVPAPKTPAPLAFRPYVNDDVGHLLAPLEAGVTQRAGAKRRELRN